MEIQIGACGLICSKCDSFIATRENNQEKLEQIAAEWRVRFQAPSITAENIRCTGCMTENAPKCGYCGFMCEIRKCAIAKNVSICGECADYPCDKLNGFLEIIGGEQAKHQKEMLTAIGEVEKKMHSVFKK